MPPPLELAFVECALPAAPAPNAAVAAPAVDPAPATRAPKSAASAPAPRPAAPAKPAPASPAPSPAPVAEAVGATLTLAEVKSKWQAIKEAARKQQAAIPGLLNSCRLMKIDGDVIVLGANGEFVFEKLQKGDTQPKVEAAFQQALGRSVRLKCVLATGSEPDSPQEEEIPD